MNCQVLELVQRYECEYDVMLQNITSILIPKYK